MRYLILLYLVFTTVSCTYENYPAVDGFHFSVNELTKTKLLPVLDEFAELSQYKKLGEGGENMLPEARKNFLMARYKNGLGYEYIVKNVLNKSCFTVATYDMGRLGKEPAIKLAADLKGYLLSEYETDFQEHDEHYCK